MTPRIALLALALALTAALSGIAQAQTILPPIKAKTKWAWAVIGDWGRVGDALSVVNASNGGFDQTGYCTSKFAASVVAAPGGDKYQTNLAKAMNNVCSTAKCTGVINTGDNFYECGLDSPERWNLDYKSVYHTANVPHLRGLKWYGSFGNHDIVQNLSTQIAYSKKDPTWVIPARYYGYSLQIDIGDPYGPIVAEFSVLNTNPMVSSYQKGKYYTQEIKTYSTPAALSEQLDWLEARLKRSTANLTFVIGHHPLISGTPTVNGLTPAQAGLLGGNGFVDGGMPDASGTPSFTRLLNMVRNNNVTAYINGHAHTLDFSQDYEDPVKYPTKYITTGSGSYPEEIDACGISRPWVLYSNIDTLKGATPLPYANCSSSSLTSGHAHPGFVIMGIDAGGVHLSYFSTFQGYIPLAANAFNYNLPFKKP